jgi:pimeloyl-ACP methyl ester carboxylesterase
LDLQLLAMVDNALDHLRARGVAMEDTVLMLGFSASGMFVNRFSLLHPRRVLAAAVGSPGGWPLAPVAEWREEVLEYPVGVADLEALSGTPFDARGFQRVRQFLFLGALDDNDSVPFSDGYDEVHSRQIFRLFGAAPVDRWEAARRIYAEADVDAEFHLYDGEGHRLSDAMMADTLRFFTDVLEEVRPSVADAADTRESVPVDALRTSDLRRSHFPGPGSGRQPSWLSRFIGPTAGKRLCWPLACGRVTGIIRRGRNGPGS